MGDQVGSVRGVGRVSAWTPLTLPRWQTLAEGVDGALAALLAPAGRLPVADEATESESEAS
jgi:hypothetical protein